MLPLKQKKLIRNFHQTTKSEVMFNWLGGHFAMLCWVFPNASVLPYRARFIEAVFMQTNTICVCRLCRARTHSHQIFGQLTSHQKPQRLLLKGVTLHSGSPSLPNTQAHRLSVVVLACGYKRLGAEAEGPCNNKLLIEGLQWAERC